MPYIKQLDSLRAVAVILVIVSHWLPSNILFNKIPSGAIGVDIFFVLSGFLITKILFQERNSCELRYKSKFNSITYFYIRRILRIFPIYYVVIFLVIIFHKRTGTDIMVSFPYFLTFTSNFYFFKTQAWDGLLSHLWSLAVEEQFYLLWPWIIFFVHQSLIPIVISIFIIIGMASQFLLSGWLLYEVLPITCFDSFGLGSILAWVAIYHSQRMNSTFRILSVLIVIFLIIGLVENFSIINQFFSLRTKISVLALWVITYILLWHENEKIFFRQILNNKLLIFLGKISYGLYLYHNFIPRLTKVINRNLFPVFPYLENWQFLSQFILFENVIFLIVLSYFSYYLFELRFLKLKKYFRLQS